MTPSVVRQLSPRLVLPGEDGGAPGLRAGATGRTPSAREDGGDQASLLVIGTLLRS